MCWVGCGSGFVESLECNDAKLASIKIVVECADRDILWISIPHAWKPFLLVQLTLQGSSRPPCRKLSNARSACICLYGPHEPPKGSSLARGRREECSRPSCISPSSSLLPHLTRNWFLYASTQNRRTSRWVLIRYGGGRRSEVNWVLIEEGH